MLIGFVSDERYVAIPDARVEFERDGETIATTRSTARGAVYADLAPGEYRITLARAGFGSKHVILRLPTQSPYQFRLLSDTLLGFCSPKWVKSGERTEFRVHSVEPYRLSLWRYGLNKEFVKLLGWHDEHGPRATMQITPDGDYTQTGVQWNRVGYGSPHHTQLIAGPEKSGLYFFHAETESGAFFSFPWIVAPAHPQAPIAVLGSNLTWNAYNNFGGRSNYINANHLPPAPIVNARQELLRYQPGVGGFADWVFPDDQYAPLSFERPELDNHIPRETQVTDPIRGRGACHQAPAEWRLLAWLEREGFAYDYYAETQLHDGTLDLDAYKLLILGPHPEYWTRVMYRRVKEWVARGGRLMYLGGNGLNCEVELRGDGTMDCKTQLLGDGSTLGMPDPNNPDVYLESRMHRTLECEAQLLGVNCTETGMMTAAPYQVKTAAHWVFDGTGLSDGDLFGFATLHERCSGGASGHETDKRGSFSPPDTLLLARGINPDNGGGEMTYYELENGGAVFSVGSIIYPSALLVDPHISRITANVIKRFLEKNFDGRK